MRVAFKAMSFLPHAEQARLIWFLRWSEGEIGQLQSNFSAVLAAQVNGLLTPVPQDEFLNGPIPINPTKSINWAEWMSSQERALELVDRERTIRKAWNAVSRADKEVLALAFCIPPLPLRKSFGPYGNLAERTDAAHRYYRGRRRRLQFQIWLDRVARDGKHHSARIKIGYAVSEITMQCEVMAAATAARYLWALRGFNVDSEA